MTNQLRLTGLVAASLLGNPAPVRADASTPSEVRASAGDEVREGTRAMVQVGVVAVAVLLTLGLIGGIADTIFASLTAPRSGRRWCPCEVKRIRDELEWVEELLMFSVPPGVAVPHHIWATLRNGFKDLRRKEFGAAEYAARYLGGWWRGC